jgi:hypothetical protein
MYGVVTYPVLRGQWSWWCANGLSHMPFSRMGNEIMLKVVWSIPTYVMRCFQLPFATCEDMRKIIADYWCCFKDGKSKMHLRSWEWLWSPKNMGGMRFLRHGALRSGNVWTSVLVSSNRAQLPLCSGLERPLFRRWWLLERTCLSSFSFLCIVQHLAW